VQCELALSPLPAIAEPGRAVTFSIPTEKKFAGRLENLDALRGLCAILVILQHVIPRNWEGYGLIRSDPTLYLDLGRVGVAGFFLISGYLIPFNIPKGKNPIRTFWIARFFRLWPVYWLSIALTLLTGSSKIVPTFKSVFANCLMVQGLLGVPDMEGTFWTLQIELVFYFLITAMIALRLLNNAEWFKVMFYSMVAVSMIMSAARGYLHIRFPVALPMALTLMFLGASLRSRRMVSRSLPSSMMIVYAVSLIPICGMGYSVKLTVLDDPYRWMVAYTAGLCLFLLFEKTRHAPRFTVWLGTISYSIYLLHPIVMKIRDVLFTSRAPLLGVMFVLVLTVVVSWVVYRSVESPSQRLGKNIIRKIQANRSVTQHGGQIRP
jgi:peptidoglycan/LPS O-acetylase OafA/YrhL